MTIYNAPAAVQHVAVVSGPRWSPQPSLAFTKTIVPTLLGCRENTRYPLPCIWKFLRQQACHIFAAGPVRRHQHFNMPKIARLLCLMALVFVIFVTATPIPSDEAVEAPTQAYIDRLRSEGYTEVSLAHGNFTESRSN